MKFKMASGMNKTFPSAGFNVIASKIASSGTNLSVNAVLNARNNTPDRIIQIPQTAPRMAAAFAVASRFSDMRSHHVTISIFFYQLKWIDLNEEKELLKDF